MRPPDWLRSRGVVYDRHGGSVEVRTDGNCIVLALANGSEVGQEVIVSLDAARTLAGLLATMIDEAARRWHDGRTTPPPKPRA